MVRALVVDDEPEMATLIARGLRGEEYLVDIADNGIDALSLAGEGLGYDVAVVDVMLPGMSGFELCRRLKEAVPGIGILLLTARDAVDDRVRGLDAGADDYLTKPFHFAELAARLRALRRRGTLGATRIEVGDTVLDLARQQVVAGDRKIRLSRTEFDLLRMLAEHPGEVCERAAILGEIWGSSRYDPNIVDQYVSYLRRKLDAGGSELRIATVRGVGFRLDQPASAAAGPAGSPPSA
jgi:two-component system, OmpR family, response regulator